MKPTLIILLIIAATITVAALGWRSWDGKTDASNDAKQRINDDQVLSVPQVQPIQTTAFINRGILESTLSLAPKQIPGRPLAGVVNHHVLAPDLLARFWKTLKAAHPNAHRLIIISPDHFTAGRGEISVTNRDYATPSGLMPADTKFVETILEQGMATLENGRIFEEEHGVGALIPFAQREFSEAQIVPITMRNSLSGEAAMAFGKRLAQLADESTILIVSSDMSHYLTEAQALKNDQTTLKHLEDLETDFFRQGSDDFLDNRAGLLALKGYLEEKNIPFEFELLDHSISSRYGGSSGFTTSYITGFWLKK